jgi:hypothetical protein
MPTFRRLLAVPALVAVGAMLLVSPAAAGRDEGLDPQVRWAGPLELIGDPVPTVTADRRSSLSPPTAIRPARASGTGALAAAPSPLAPVTLGGFDAIGDIDGATPADPTGAMGASWFFTAVNTSFALFDLTGAPVVGPFDLDSLDPDLAGEFAFDPKVVYDQYNDTFVMVHLVQEDSPRASDIVVTTIPDATADDQSTWCTTILDGDQVPGDGDLWADYPGLGYAADHVTITTNQFTFPVATASFRYAQVLSITKASLYDCSTEPVGVVFAGTQTENADGSAAFTLQPAQTVGGAETDQFLVSFEPRGKDSFLTLWRMRPSATGAGLKRTTLFTGKVKIPFLATQGGVNDLFDDEFWWDPGDFRLVNAFYDADRNELFTAHAVRKNLKPDPVTGAYIEAAARWYEVNPASKLKNSVISRKGVVGEPEVEVGWPVVASDGSGNLFIAFSRASGVTGEFLSAWVAEVPPSSTSAASLLLVPGLGVYDASNGPERWGDYNGIGRDPLDGSTIAAINQYATDLNTFQQTVQLVQHA